MGRVEGKVAIVTGGAMGIGAAICRLLAREGASVVVTDINDSVGEETAAAINEAGGCAVYCHQDVTEPASWQRVIALATEEFGRVNILVNNAGTGAYVNIEEETLEGWRRIININMDSVFMGTQVAIESMKGRGGSVINISSIMGLVGDGDVPAYNAAKAGVRNFTKSAALHCAKNGYKIRVNSVHPGYILTP